MILLDIKERGKDCGLDCTGLRVGQMVGFLVSNDKPNLQAV